MFQVHDEIMHSRQITSNTTHYTISISYFNPRILRSWRNEYYVLWTKRRIRNAKVADLLQEDWCWMDNITVEGSR